jgi:hypothetical protein
MKLFTLVLVAAVAVGCSEATNPAAPSAVPGGSTDVVNPYNADHGGRSLIANLTGAAGTGTVHVSANAGQGEFCYSVEVEVTSPATALYMHHGDWQLLLPLGAPGSECIDGLDRALVRDVLKSPESYTLVLHVQSGATSSGTLMFHRQPY